MIKREEEEEKEKEKKQPRSMPDSMSKQTSSHWQTTCNMFVVVVVTCCCYSWSASLPLPYGAALRRLSALPVVVLPDWLDCICCCCLLSTHIDISCRLTCFCLLSAHVCVCVCVCAALLLPLIYNSSGDFLLYSTLACALQNAALTFFLFATIEFQIST